MAVAVGNNGTVLTIQAEGFHRVDSGTNANLRRVAWKPHEDKALVVGNDGAAYILEARGLQKIHGADNNLRSIAWHPEEDYALIVGNAYRPSLAGLIPAATMYLFDGKKSTLTPVQPPTVNTIDLISAAWKPDGEYCIVVGYDVVWHSSTAFVYSKDGVRPLPWKEERVYPTGFDWRPQGDYGLIVTGGPSSSEGEGTVYRFAKDVRRGIHKLYTDKKWHISCVAWSPDGSIALILGSPHSRSFSA
jgi:WD40 repeat protein